MKGILLKLIFVSLTTAVYSQTIADNPYGMTTAQNMAWLTVLKDVDKAKQLALIQNRFFKQQTPLSTNSSEDVPVLVIDGIPISKLIDLKVRAFLTTELTADEVDIEVLEKEPEGLYVDKRWTGLILITITDWRTRKKLYRLR